MTINGWENMDVGMRVKDAFGDMVQGIDVRSGPGGTKDFHIKLTFGKLENVTGEDMRSAIQAHLAQSAPSNFGMTFKVTF